MNKIILVGVIVLVAGLGIWFYMSQSDKDGVVTPNKDSATGYTVAMKEQDINNQSGTATISDENGKAKVTIKVAAGEKDVPQPAHIHVGACPLPGVVAYPLNDVVNGVSETTLDVSTKDLLSKLPLAVNIHKSGEDATAYVSCGDITADAMAKK